MYTIPLFKHRVAFKHRWRSIPAVGGFPGDFRVRLLLESIYHFSCFPFSVISNNRRRGCLRLPRPDQWTICAPLCNSSRFQNLPHTFLYQSKRSWRRYQYIAKEAETSNIYERSLGHRDMSGTLLESLAYERVDAIEFFLTYTFLKN